MKLLKNLKIGNIDNLISLAVFGSYETKYWIKDKSDIDILVLMEKREDVMDEFDLEEILEPILKEYFEYDDIHLTFINMKDYDSIFARQYIDSNDKLIINKFKEIDFRLYVNKYLRENQWLIEKTKKDTLKLMQGAIEEYKVSKSVFIKRAIIGYFQDFTEYIIDMAETYLVMTENYVDGYSGVELIKRAGLYGFFDDNLTAFLISAVKLRNRYTHDYYKRDRVEEDILNYAISKVEFLKIFLRVSEEKIRLDAENAN